MYNPTSIFEELVICQRQHIKTIIYSLYLTLESIKSHGVTEKEITSCPVGSREKKSWEMCHTKGETVVMSSTTKTCVLTERKASTNTTCSVRRMTESKREQEKGGVGLEALLKMFNHCNLFFAFLLVQHIVQDDNAAQECQRKGM